jgi:Thioesterase-like superfamily
MEVDYNIHKSNSTYFADLDVARTALMSRMYTPGIAITNKEMDDEASTMGGGGEQPNKRPFFIALGSVYCSFRREIKPYERFEIRTQIAAWDDKWTYLLSYFLRPEKRKGEGKILLATSLSKYVVKRGRMTLSPERIFRAGGFLPPRPEGWPKPPMVGKSTVESDNTSTIGTPSADGIGTAVDSVDERLIRCVLTLGNDQLPSPDVLEGQRRQNSESWGVHDWSWEKIEQERRRNLQMIEGYVKLDEKLHGEWKA